MTKVLVVVDMQNDFIDGALANPEAQAIVKPMAEFIRNWEGKIYFTMDTHFQNYMNTVEGKHLPVPHCLIGTHGHSLNKEIEEALKEKKASGITKNTFGSTTLAEKLDYEDYLNPLEVYFCGVCTDICVISNVILAKTKLPETEFYVIENLCAGVTSEKHAAAIEVMKSLQVEIVNAKNGEIK